MNAANIFAYTEQLQGLRNIYLLDFVDPNIYKFVSNWYIPVIMQAVNLSQFQNDPEWISQKMERVSVEQAQEALNVLKKLNFVLEDKNGRLKLNNRVYNKSKTGQKLTSKAFGAHHQLVQLAGLAQSNNPKLEPDINTVILPVNNETLKLIKKAIVEFKKKLFSYSKANKAPDKLYQLNFQLFPLLK